MPTRLSETVAMIDEDRRLVLQLPADVPVGTHRVIGVVDEAIETAP